MLRNITLITTFSVMAGSCLAEDNFAYDQAKNAGVVKCLPAVKVLTDFLVKGNIHGAHSKWATDRTDKQMFTSTIEKTFSDGAAIYSIFVAPVTSGECAAAYERVSYWAKSCPATAIDIFSTYTNQGELNSNVLRLSSSKGMTAYLMPAGTGCVSIVKEILMDGNNP